MLMASQAPKVAAQTALSGIRAAIGIATLAAINDQHVEVALVLGNAENGSWVDAMHLEVRIGGDSPISDIHPIGEDCVIPCDGGKNSRSVGSGGLVLKAKDGTLFEVNRSVALRVESGAEKISPFEMDKP